MPFCAFFNVRLEKHWGPIHFTAPSANERPILDHVRSPALGVPTFPVTIFRLVPHVTFFNFLPDIPLLLPLL